MTDYTSFTLVFKGDLRQYRANPLNAGTQYGTPYAVGVGDYMTRYDAMRKALNAITCIRADDARSALDMKAIASKALDEAT